MKKLFILFIVVLFLLCASVLHADYWITSDWSDSTSYDSIVDLNGNRQPGNLILDAPDVWNWEYMCSLSGASNVNDLCRSNDGIIYAATGDSGRIHRSINSGTTWGIAADLWGPGFTRTFYVTKSFDSILFAGGIMRNGIGVVFYSYDAGTTWSSGDSSLPRTVYSIAKTPTRLFAGIGIVIANNDKIFLSIDNGQSWQRPEIASFGDYNMLSLLASDSVTILGGTGPNKGYLVRSSDNGSSWTKIDSLNTSIQSMAKANADTLFCCTSGGDVYRSLDAGTTWSIEGLVPNALELNRILCTGNGMVFSCGKTTGNAGIVYRSIDLGESWEEGADVSAGYSILSLVDTQEGFLIAGTNIDASIYRAGYFLEGHLISPVYNTGGENGSMEYGVIQWSDSLNGGGIYVKVRSDTLPSMPSHISWEFIPFISNGDSIASSPAANNGDCYIQYYVQFQSEDPGATPVLQELSIEYSIDTIGPNAVSAVAYDGDIQLNGIDDDDYAIITFSEPTNKFQIPGGMIDSVLALTPDSCTWGSIDTSYWNPGSNGVSLIIQLNPTAMVYPGITRIYPDAVIEDIWGNGAFGSVPLTGSFDDTIPPAITSAFASDCIDSIEGVDPDDYVVLSFDQTTNTPTINAGNINNVLLLSNGHTWGSIDSAVWSIDSLVLTVLLDTLGGPTIEVGDTIFPDTATILDVNGNECYSPVILGGNFGDYGPVITSAMAYEAAPNIAGIDSGDYVCLYFNEETNGPDINSTNINSILALSGSHTWTPILDSPSQWNGAKDIFRVFFADNMPTIAVGDTIYPDSATITDPQGRPCIHPVVLEGSFNPGVEEGEASINFPRRLELSIAPNPCFGKAEISYGIPLRSSVNDKVSAEISIYDLSGRRIEIIQSEFLLPGSYSCFIDKKTKAGIYFVRLATPEGTLTRKLILLR